MTREAWAARFDARYGDGAFARLCRRLEQPGRTFSSIAAQFGVTRERARQWHRFLMPDAPAGRERRRRHQWQRDWQDLLHDDLFGTFYQHARRHVPAEWIKPVRTTHGYSRVRARINQRDVVLRRARARRLKDGSAEAVRVTRPAGHAQFVYVWLSDETFLFLPMSALPRAGSVSAGHDRSSYAPFCNTFDAVRLAADETTARVAVD